MAEKKKLKDYTIGAFIKVWADATVKAESLEQAVELSRKLGTEDFIACSGNAFNDYSMRIIQVYDADFDMGV